MPKAPIQKKYLEILRALGLPLDNNGYWWVSNAKRAVEEIKSMRESTNTVMSVRGDRLIRQETIAGNRGEQLIIAIEAGSGYPNSVPSVSVRESNAEDTVKPKLIYKGETPKILPYAYDSSTSLLAHRNILIASYGISWKTSKIA